MLSMIYFTGIIALVATGHAAYYTWGKVVEHLNTADVPMWKILVGGGIAFTATLSATFLLFYLAFMGIAGAMGLLGVSCGLVQIGG